MGKADTILEHSGVGTDVGSSQSCSKSSQGHRSESKQVCDGSRLGRSREKRLNLLVLPELAFSGELISSTLLRFLDDPYIFPTSIP